jgi:hypothetical protein
MVIVKNKFKDNALAKLLAFIVAATESSAGHAFAPADKVKEIAAAQPTFLVVDEATKNPADATQIKVSSTAAAKAALEAAAGAKATTAAAVEIKLESGVPVPEGKRGPTRVEVYPFSKMALGQSFSSLLPLSARIRQRL